MGYLEMEIQEMRHAQREHAHINPLDTKEDVIGVIENTHSVECPYMVLQIKNEGKERLKIISCDKYLFQKECHLP